MSERDRAEHGDTTVAETLDGSSGSARSLSSPLDGGRFAAGDLIDARYRVVGLLGRGGMGEVYRAEDLKLGEVVALKFLPERLAHDARALARLHEEVRTARQISHRSVVRVHDIGEAEGQPFLTMEFVDGEDLSSLLRRIGALPEAKAVELARQICAGLAAAHDRGIVHRDLKPANIMIDGEGRAKINDFGLATLESADAREHGGTPAYMAPEQIEGKPATLASDVYSLGLVLHEMWTGERLLQESEPIAMLRERRELGAAGSFESKAEMDAGVARVIQSCLNEEPAKRPQSATEVALRLPGGDPLGAALAAGETPSPEMVARAPIAGALSKPLGALMLGAALLSIAVFTQVAGKLSVYSYDEPLERQVLEHQASTLLESTGWATARHSYSGFRPHRLTFYRSRSSRTHRGWLEAAERRPTLVEFWYRESATPLYSGLLLAPSPGAEIPLPWRPGQALVRLDSQGRLLELFAMPGDERLHPREAGSETLELWQESGLDPQRFTAIEPDTAPDFYADRLVSWTGSYEPGEDAEDGTRIRVDAAYRGGDLLSWRVTERLEGMPESIAPDVSVASALWVFLAMLVIGGWLARQNLAFGRGDRRGATVLALAVAFLTLWNSGLSDLSSLVTYTPVFGLLGITALLAVAAWLSYVAIEPYLRKIMPRSQVSWSRLLRGQWRDPLVGRDFLVGLSLMSTLYAASAIVRWLLHLERGGSLDLFYPHGTAALDGPLRSVANLFHLTNLLVPMGVMFLFVLPRIVFRHPPLRPLGTVLGYLSVIAFAAFWNGGLGAGLPIAIGIVVAARLGGPVALIGFGVFAGNLMLVPVSADPGIWWAPNSWIGVGYVAMLAIVAFSIATGTSELPRPTDG